MKTFTVELALIQPIGDYTEVRKFTDVTDFHIDEFGFGGILRVMGQDGIPVFVTAWSNVYVMSMSDVK